MRKPRNRALRTQLILMMASFVFVITFLGYGGLKSFSYWQDYRFRATLTGGPLRAAEAMDAGRMPAQDDLRALNELSAAAGRQYEIDEFKVLIVLVLISIGCGAAISTVIARRFVRPIEAVAAAARQVAGGDLAARAETSVRGAGEIGQLVDDFNFMAAELQSYDRRVKQNAAATAHELRTPLMILQGRLEALADGVFEPSAEEYGRLIAQIRLLARIVDDLSTLSLAQAGRLTLNLAPHDLGDIAGDVVETFAVRAREAGVEVSTAFERAPAHADRQRIMQSIGAMVDNALRYAASGAELRVETRLDADQAVLRVLDRGPGPPTVPDANLFDAFVRGDESRSRSSGGTGLGLAVVRAIAEAHGGSVAALERQGGGAEFRMTLPVMVRG